MKTANENNHSRMLALTIALPLLVLAACTQSGTQNTTAVGESQTGTPSDIPRVPFGNQPCRTFSTDEMKKLGFTVPKPFEPGRDPDRLAFDNTCDFGYLTIEYTSQGNYKDQKDNLRNSGRHPPADVPDAFYDVLGNLWFAEKGYYVVIPNNVSDAEKEKVAHAIAAKL